MISASRFYIFIDLDTMQLLRSINVKINDFVRPIPTHMVPETDYKFQIVFDDS